MPLNYAEDQWISSSWEFRRGRLLLIPGDSPLGLRLPMDSLIENPENELAPHPAPDLFAEVPELAKFHKKAKKRCAKTDTDDH